MLCRLRLRHRAVHRDSKSKRKKGKYMSMQMREQSAGEKEGKSRPGA